MPSSTIRSRTLRQIALPSAGLLLLLALLAGAAAPPPALAQGLALDTQLLTSDLVRPLAMVSANDGTGRLFIVQQTGEIVIWNGVSLEATPFLDLSDEVICCGERGLLGLAFHPDYASNGELFVNYTRDLPDEPLQTVVARYTVSVDPDVVDESSEEILLVFDQLANNHNGGDLAFGPDGYLYVASGDGGGGGDPGENGQDLSTLLGKILRIDVDSTPDPGLDYTIPPDNPFVGVAGAREEIWSYGLRNPFRFSFDRKTGDLWIGDVGQVSWEEVDFQPASSPGGENYGWDCREGAHDYDDPNGDMNAGCTGSGYTDPVLEYPHGNVGNGPRCSVTGGFRYRGDAEPRLRGVYLYADFCSGEVLGTVPRCDGAWESRVVLDTAFHVTGFGQDAAGELYVTDRVDSADPDSEVYRLVLAAGSGGPDLQLSSGSLDFGEVEVGDTVDLPFTLTNVNGGPEAVAVATRTLSDTGLFSLDVGGGSKPCFAAGRPCLSPAGHCTLAVRLQAGSTGAVSETLTFEGNFEPAIIALTANVVPCASEVDLDLTSTTVTGTETHRACDTLTAGPEVTVANGGDLTLQAGTRIVLRDGFSVASGGSLVLEIF
jgi:glucose/arabinose dehydrogenase